MTHRLQPHQNSILMNEMMFGWALQGATEELATYRLTPDTNTFRGIAAHLVISRHGLGQSLGMNVKDLPWGDIGEGMDAGFKESSDYPDLSTIHQAWKDLEEIFRPGLLATDESKLDGPSPFPLPWDDQATMEDFVALTVVHESYHIGQMGLMVKAKTGAGLMNPPA